LFGQASARVELHDNVHSPRVKF